MSINQIEKQAIKQMIERFFEGSAEYNSCLSGKCEIGKGGYDLAAQMTYNSRHSVDIECGDYNKYIIEDDGSLESKELANLLTQVFDKLNISYQDYSFIAEPKYTTKFAGHNFYGDEEYKFKTIDFETFTIKDKNNSSFVIKADYFFGDLLSSISIKKANEETIKELIDHFAGSSFEPSHAYGDLAVEYGLLKRVSSYEDLDIEKIFRSVKGEESSHDSEYFSYDWGDGELIDEENDTFFYHAEIFVDDKGQLDVNLLRYYTSETVEEEMLSSEQHITLLNIMQKKMQESGFQFENYEAKFKCDCPYLSVNKQNRTDVVIEAPVVLSDGFLSELLSRCDLRYENGDKVTSLEDLKENTWITTYAQYRNPKNEITIELQIDGVSSTQGPPVSAWLSSTESYELKAKIKEACQANSISFDSLENQLSKAAQNERSKN